MKHNPIAPLTMTAYGSHGYGVRAVVTALTSPCPRLISPITAAGFLFHPARLRPSGKSNGREVTTLSIRQMVTVKAGGTDESPGNLKENGMTPEEENDIRIEMELSRIGDRRKGTDEFEGYFKMEEEEEETWDR
jgi:hypothetical protein